MGVISLLNKNEFKVTDNITIKIPTVGEYRKDDLGQQLQFLMHLFIITPSDNMVELADMGRDFTKISEYQFFIELFYSEFIFTTQGNRKHTDSTILFENLDFSKCHLVEKNNNIVIVNDADEIIINEIIYKRLSAIFCEILNCKKYRRKPADETAKKFILDFHRERIENKRKRGQKRQDEINQFDELIVALVCDKGFPYDFESINLLTIYDFYVCVRQIIKNTNYNNLMRGVYSGFGTVDIKKIRSSQLNYLSFRDD